MVITLNALLASQGRLPQSDYSFSELASILNVTEQSIRLYIKQGRLHAWKTSPRKWGRIPHAEVERFFLAFNAPKAVAAVKRGPEPSVLEALKTAPFTTGDAMRAVIPPMHDYIGGRMEDSERIIHEMHLSEGFTPVGDGAHLMSHGLQAGAAEEAH